MSQKLTRRSALIGAGALAGFGMLPAARAAVPVQGVPEGAFQVLNRSIAPSRYFRVPFLLRTDADTLIAGSDANRATTGDSADNIDAVTRRKEDASSKALKSGWGAPSIVEAIEMEDFAPDSGYAQDSASVIDAIVGQDRSSGRLLMVIDLFPWNGGVFEHLDVSVDSPTTGGRVRTIAQGDGFATVGGRKMLLLSTTNTTGDADGLTGTINNNTDRSLFDRVADVNGPKDGQGRTKVFVLNGTPRAYSDKGVDDSNLSLGEPTEYTLDSEFVLYKGQEAQTVQQVGSDEMVPLKVFYKASPLQVFNTNFTVQAVSEDDGGTWALDRLLNTEFRSPDSHYSLVAPGAATQMRGGAHAGRILVPVYTQVSGGVKAQTIFTDDAGATWHRGDYVPGDIAMHESSVIEAAPGVLRSFNRHAAGSGGKVLTCESTDGGQTWSALTSAFGDDEPGVGCLVSALGLEQTLVSEETGKELPSLVVVSADDKARKHGIAHFGVVHTDGTGGVRTRIEWVGTYEITDADTLFAYSSVAEMADGAIYCMYETSPSDAWSDGLQAMYLQELPRP